MDRVQEILFNRWQEAYKKRGLDAGWEFWARIAANKFSEYERRSLRAQKNPAAATTGNKTQSNLIYRPSLSRKAGADHA